MRARIIRRMNPAQTAFDAEPQLFQYGCKNLDMLKAIATAILFKEASLNLLRINTGVLRKYRVQVSEREHVQVGLNELGEVVKARFLLR